MKISYVLALALASNLMLNAEEAVNLSPVTLDEPTNAQIAGKGAILENSDIAKSLSNLNGFTMERKGGGGSEVYYRSQTAARLPVLIDGSTLNGGCGMRMDTPITYISAQNYSSVRIVKGPQDVRYGALISGGIFFDREIERLSKPSFGGNVSVLGGSFKRFETTADVAAGNELGSLEVSGGHYESGDYKSGDGQKMHTHYKRNSVSLVGTLTPTDTTALQLSADLGEGEAAYADRMRDGVQFDRKSFGLKFEQDVGEHKIRLSSYYHQIDHIMDNFTMRPVVPGTGRGKGYSISHPIRDMYGFKLEGELDFDDLTSFVGAGYSQDSFKWRGAGTGGAGVSKAKMDAAVSKPHVKERKVTYKTIYTQNEYVAQNDYGLFGGLRLDMGERKLLKTHKIRRENLFSGFFRYEKYLQNLTLYAGLGHAQRMPDHWETNKDAKLALNKERNTQLDFGAVLKDQNYELNANFFISKMDDYIMLKYNPMGMSSSAFNTDALLYGGEIEGTTLLADMFRISPLAFKLSAGLEKPDWFVKADFYANASQNRAQKGYGDVGGMDLGKSDSFWTLELRAGYKYNNYQFLLVAENLNDAKYAYHNSKGGYGGGIAGYETIPNGTRLYEPGRSFWAKFKVHF